MKTEKFHELKMDELTNRLRELKEKLFRLRFSHATGQLANPMEMAGCKKDIARVKTVLREREIKALAAGLKKQAVKNEASKDTAVKPAAKKPAAEKAEKPPAAETAKKKPAAKKAAAPAE